MSDRSIPTKTSSSGDRRIFPRAPSSSSDPLKTPPSSIPANTCPPGLVCPVPSCPLFLKGETHHRYLRRHLNHPGLYGRTGQEKEVWINLHKAEHERLLATLGLALFHNPNPGGAGHADRVNIIRLAEDNNADEEVDNCRI